MIWRILAAIGFAASLYAQTSAEITGRVTDASKAVVPGATITAVNTDKRTERTTVSNDQGYYDLPSLDTGAYEITVQIAGFKPVTRSARKLDVSSPRASISAWRSGVAEGAGDGGAPARSQYRAAWNRITEEKIELPLNAQASRSS
jgi:hypothetical protein